MEEFREAWMLPGLALGHSRLPGVDGVIRSLPARKYPKRFPDTTA